MNRAANELRARRERDRAKADRFPAELRPHPGYVYEGPDVDDRGVLWLDAGVLIDYGAVERPRTSRRG